MTGKAPAHLVTYLTPGEYRVVREAIMARIQTSRFTRSLQRFLKKLDSAATLAGAPMGANNGTGQPYWFKCPKCRTYRDPRAGLDCVRTGRTRPLTKAQRGKGGARVLQERHEFYCHTCQRYGWSRQKDLLRFPLKDSS